MFEAFNIGGMAPLLTKTHLGEARVALCSLIPEFNESVTFTVDLVYHGSSNVKQGRVTMRGILERPLKQAPTSAATPPPPIAATAVKPLEYPTEKRVEMTSDKRGGVAAALLAQDISFDESVTAEIDDKPNEIVAVTAVGDGSSATPAGADKTVEFDDSKPLKLRLDRLQIRDVKDKGNAFNKQDPALCITVGSAKTFETKW